MVVVVVVVAAATAAVANVIVFVHETAVASWQLAAVRV